MADYVLAGLAKRRAELAGEAETLRARLAQIGTDLDHLDAVIRLFDPDHDLAGTRPKRPRGPDVARPRKMSRFVLGVLREAAEPVPTSDVAARFMVERGMDGVMRQVEAKIVKRSDAAKGFTVLPKRWIVERTTAWLNRYTADSAPRDATACPRARR